MAGDGRGVAVSYALGALAFAAYAVASGQDANWDLQNYHDYDAFALLHWRYPLDVAPAGPQTYLNPLPYVLPYLLRRHLPAVFAAVALAMVQALVVPLAWALSGRVVEGRDNGALAIRAFATVTSVTGAMVLSEVGTSLADLLLALPGLAALLAVLGADAAQDGRRADRLHALAGLLSGGAAGLKLTNGVVVVGILGAVLLPWRGWPRGVRAAGLVGLGAAAGAALSGGWWAFYLWRSFGSPAFPFLNSVFRSPSAALLDFSDPRFLPRGVGDALTYPFRIAAGLHPTAEMAFRDWRFALALPLCAALAVVTLARDRPVPASRLALLQASAFLFAGVGAWLFGFAIQRYAIVFEVVCGLLAIAAAAALLPKPWSLPACLAIALATVASTQPADWWRRPWPDAYKPRPPAEVVAAPAAFLMTAVPLGYWVSAFPYGSRSYLLYPEMLPPGGRLAQRLGDGLDRPPGGTVWGVGLDVPIEPNVRASMAARGFVLAPPCYRAQSIRWVATVFCRAEHAGRRPFAAADLRIGQEVSFSDQGSGWIYEISGWKGPDPGSTWAAGPVSTLAFAPEAAAGKLVVEFEVAGLVSRSWPESEVEVSVPGGAAAARWLFHWADERWSWRTVCVPEASRLQDGVLEVSFRPSTPPSPRNVGVGARPGPDTLPLGFALRTMKLRYARPGECED